jgi:hypothetical protein
VVAVSFEFYDIIRLWLAVACFELVWSCHDKVCRF